ncbi:MAG TPA: hypothetical protein DCS93_27435 [Microscillaceae bacterium]|nr:hypothetical protein [Microscillaceae bacterium]
MTSYKYVHYLLIGLIGLCLTGTSIRGWGQNMPQPIDIYTGLANSSNPSELTAIGNRLIFNATGSGIGKEPYLSDGTLAGTVLLRDIFAGANSSNARYFTGFTVGVNIYAYYFANDNTNSGALYRTNIADGTTEFVVNVNPQGSASSTPGAGNGQFLVNVSGTLFFAGQDPSGRQELFKSDGTAGGTVLVKDINTNSIGGFTLPSNPQNLTNVNGKLFFTADANFDGGASNVNRELWVSDGTAAGTRLVKDINVGNNNSSNPNNLVEKNGLCFFFANDGSGEALWRSDGTDAGTVKLSLPAGTTVDEAAGLIVMDHFLIFAASNATLGNELWISDGTNSMPVDLNPGSGSSNPSNFVAINSTFYFSATNGTSGTELWKSNATISGTVMVKDIFPGSFGSSPENITKVRVGFSASEIYFTALTATNGRELWKSDGTDAGTVLVKDLNPSPSANASKISELVAVPTTVNQDALFFSAFDGDNNVGTELWAVAPFTCPTATIAYASSTLCKNAGTATVNLISSDGTDLTGGTYTATGGLPINSATGEITLNSGLASGTYTITYNVIQGTCDIQASTVITLIDGGNAPTENVRVAGGGFGFGSNPTSTSDGTASLVISPDGQYLYVPDERTHVIKRVEIVSGIISVIAGSSGNSGLIDGNGTAARFNFPTGLAIDIAGTLYVSDKDNHAIRKIVDPNGAAVVSTITGNGSAGDVIGATTAARFREPSGIALDLSNNHLYVADKNNHKIKKIDLNSNTVTILAGAPIGTLFASGAVDGAASSARFFFPTDVALDDSGNLFVADRHNNLIRKVLIANGTTSTFAGNISQTNAGAINGTAINARFNHPAGVTVDKEGNVFVADTRNHLIRKISNGNVTTAAGTGVAGFADDNFASNVEFNFPTGVIADLEQNVYVSDKLNGWVRKYFINNPNGKVTSGQQVCAGSSGSLTLSGHSGAVTKWQSSTDGINWTDIANTSTVLNYTNVSTHTFYRAIVQSGVCGVAPSNYAVINIASPTAAVSGGDQTRCGAGSVTLIATGATEGNYRWYQSAVGGTALSTSASFTTPTLPVGTYTFYVSVVGAACEGARVPVNVIVTEPPTPTIAGATAICVGQIETYTTTDNAGSTYNWELTNPTMGTIVGGQGTASVTIEWNGTPAVGSLTVTETSSQACVVTSAPLNITFNAIAASPVVMNTARCGTGDLVLNASKADGSQLFANESFRWYDAATGGVLLESNTGSFTVVNLSATTVYYVSFYNGNCESERVPVSAQVITGVAKPLVSDYRICGIGLLEMTAVSAEQNIRYRWYDAEVGGTLLQDNANPSYVVGVLTDVTYYVSVYLPGCDFESDRAVVNVTLSPLAGGIVGPDQMIQKGDVPATINSLQAASGGFGFLTYSWETSTNGIDWSLIAGATDTTYTPDALFVTTYFRRLVNSAECGQMESNVVKVEVVKPLEVPANFHGQITAVDTVWAVKLGWTNSDPRTEGFYLEKGDGVNFTPLVTLSVNDTSYTDFGSILGDKAYYRIRAFKGTLVSDYAQIRIAPDKQTTGISETMAEHTEIFPNPVETQTKVRLDMASTGEGEIILRNIQGMALAKYPFSKFATTKEVTLRLNNLKAGIYWLEIKLGDQRTVKRILKQ